MNAMPPFFPGSHVRDAAPSGEPDAATQHWHALIEAGDLVASLAGVEIAPADEDRRDFPALIRETDAWRRERAGHGLADLAAVMEPGIAALLAIRERGADPSPAARALWHEFAAARKGLFALLPSTETAGCE